MTERAKDAGLVLLFAAVVFMFGYGLGRRAAAPHVAPAPMAWHRCPPDCPPSPPEGDRLLGRALAGDPMLDTVAEIRAEVGKIVAQRDECLAREARR